MARAKKEELTLVRVRVIRSFETLVAGEEFDTFRTDRVQGLINGALLKVVDGGTSEAGPGAADASDSGGSPADAAPAGTAGAEPGEDPSSG